MRPHLEYASSAWDPDLKKDINSLDRVQRSAARMVTNNYNYTEGSMTAILKDLNWDSLVNRRTSARLIMMFKIVNGLVAIKASDYLESPTRITRNINQNKFRTVSARCDSYAQSYLPRTIKDWNTLSDSTVASPSINSFKEGLRQSR